MYDLPNPDHFDEWVDTFPTVIHDDFDLMHIPDPSRSGALCGPVVGETGAYLDDTYHIDDDFCPACGVIYLAGQAVAG